MDNFEVGDKIRIKPESGFEGALAEFGLNVKKEHRVDGVNQVVIPLASQKGHIRICNMHSYGIIHVSGNSRWFYADMFQKA